jgi:VWFA-related protein
MIRRLSCLLASAVLAVVALEGASQENQTVFRSGVDLARLDVRITDASGKPIPDLRQDEVSVVENGVPRPVLLFHHVAESGRSFLETVHQTVAAEISTNQGAPRGQLYLFVFDQEHITAGNEQRARQAAETFLRRRVKPQDRVAVYGLPGPGPSLGFTANVRLARDQLQHVRGDLIRTPTGGDNDMRVHEAYEILRGNEEVLTRFLVAANGTSERTGVVPDVPVARATSDLATMRRLVREHAQSIVTRADASARRFLEYTAELLKSFRDVDGRKTVLLFSEGFHNDNVHRELDRLAAAAAETYSVVYSFDLNRRLENLGQTSLGADQFIEISNRLDPLGGLSLETGGRLFTDAGTNLDRPLDELGDTETDYYVLGFSPSAAALADRDLYQRVSVRVSRPGARVSARTGYVAGQKPTPADRRRVIDKALAAPFSQQGLRLDYTTYVGQADTPGMQRIVVSLEAELPVGTDADRFADVVFVARNASSGQIATSGSDRMALPAKAEAGTALGRSAWRVQFDLPAGTYLMRCVVREPGGLVGSADRHFSVRNLGGTEVAASDLVLGTPGEALPVRARAYAEQLLGGAVRVYGKSEQQLQDLSARLELIGLDPEAPGAGTAPARSVVGDVDRLVSTDRGVRRDLSFTVPVSGLPAGEYVAKVTVRAGSEVVADLRRQVVVAVGAPPPAATTPGSARPAPSGTPREVLRGAAVTRLVEKAAGSANTIVQRAATQARSGRWTEVLQTVATAPASDAQAARLRGLARIDREEYTAAAAELGREFSERATDADLAFVLGWARTGAGDQAGAISAFRSAVFLDPTLVPGYLAAAEAYLRLGERALAAQMLEAGLAKVPNSPELSTMLASVRK